MLGHKYVSMFESEKINLKNQNLKFFQFVSNHVSCVNWESEFTGIFAKFEMKFGHLEQELDIKNKNMCEKFFKSNEPISWKIYP
jgi:hypothetical protein